MTLLAIWNRDFSLRRERRRNIRREMDQRLNDYQQRGKGNRWKRRFNATPRYDLGTAWIA